MLTERVFSPKAERGATLHDNTAFLTGLLVGLTLPPGIPLWMSFLGGVASIGLGKLIWGGLGQNLFNPALVDRAFLQAAFPTVITTWSAQTFEVLEFQSESVSRSIEVPFDTLVAEGLQQADELEKLTVLLPPPVVPIRLDENCPLPLCELSPAEIEILQELIRHQTIARILEASPMTDFRILSLIWGLLKKKVFAFSQSSSNLLEETFIQHV